MTAKTEPGSVFPDFAGERLGPEGRNRAWLGFRSLARFSRATVRPARWVTLSLSPERGLGWGEGRIPYNAAFARHSRHSLSQPVPLAVYALLFNALAAPVPGSMRPARRAGPPGRLLGDFVWKGCWAR